MPGINSIWGRHGAALRKFVDAGTWRSAKHLSRLGRRIGGRTPRAALVASGGAMDITVLTAKLLGRGAGRTLNWAGKHPARATMMGLGAAGAIGGVRGAMSAVRATYPVPATNRPLPPVQGPGYNTWGSARRGPMQPNNLGATGDLTLAMHKVRHS